MSYTILFHDGSEKQVDGPVSIAAITEAIGNDRWWMINLRDGRFLYAELYTWGVPLNERATTEYRKQLRRLYGCTYEMAPVKFIHGHVVISQEDFSSWQW